MLTVMTFQESADINTTKSSHCDSLKGQVLTQPIISPQGEFLADAGEKIRQGKAMEIENAGVMVAYVDESGQRS